MAAARRREPASLRLDVRLANDAIVIVGLFRQIGSEIRAADLISMGLETLPIEPVVMQLLTRARLATSVRIINGLVPGNLTRALDGEPIGTLIHT